MMDDKCFDTSSMGLSARINFCAGNHNLPRNGRRRTEETEEKNRGAGPCSLPGSVPDILCPCRHARLLGGVGFYHSSPRPLPLRTHLPSQEGSGTPGAENTVQRKRIRP